MIAARVGSVRLSIARVSQKECVGRGAEEERNVRVYLAITVFDQRYANGLFKLVQAKKRRNHCVTTTINLYMQRSTLFGRQSCGLSDLVLELLKLVPRSRDVLRGQT